MYGFYFHFLILIINFKARIQNISENTIFRRKSDELRSKICRSREKDAKLNKCESFA